MIRVDNLRKEYFDLRRGRFAAVDGVSFAADQGEMFGLIGPNGAGKTTTLRILSTVLKPSSGTALIDGHNVATQSSEVRHRIGFMSANTAVYERMTGWEMVEHFGLLYGIDRDELHQRMERLFDQLSMNDVRDRMGGKMSSGMKQKVSIARAIIHDPPVMIFDEPTVGLDVVVGRALLHTITHLKEQGKCIIFSTHIMTEVEKLCDRVGIMHRGHLLACGTLDELREQYKENDLEELFFQLITSYNREHPLDSRDLVSEDETIGDDFFEQDSA